MNKLNNIVTNPIAKSSRVRRNLGFTLIELLVVISVLAAIAGMTSVALDVYQQDAEEKLTRVEMQRIANAIRRFKEDTGYWPKTGPFDYSSVLTTEPSASYPMSQYRDDYFNHDANFWWLFTQPPKHIGYWNESSKTPEDRTDKVNQLWPWDINVGMGWQGPYINLDAIRTITLDTINSNGGQKCQGLGNSTIQAIAGKPHTSYPDSITKKIPALLDRFQRTYKQKLAKLPVENLSTPDYDGQEAKFCHVTKVKVKADDGSYYWEYQLVKYSGSPYLYQIKFTNFGHNACTQDSTPSKSITCVVLRSFGEDGIDQHGSDNSDDIVFILQVNQELGES